MEASELQMSMVSNEIAYCEKVMSDNAFAVGVWPMGSRQDMTEYEAARFRYSEAHARLIYLRGFHEHLGILLMFQRANLSDPKTGGG